MNLPFPSCSFFNRAVCVLHPYVPPVFTQADPDIWPLFPRSFASFRPLRSSLNPILTWESCLVTFLPVQPAVILVIVMPLCDWSRTDTKKHPHSGFISTVRPSRSLCLQFRAGTVLICQSSARNACEHRWKWRRRGEYLHHAPGLR